MALYSSLSPRHCRFDRTDGVVRQLPVTIPRSPYSISPTRRLLVNTDFVPVPLTTNLFHLTTGVAISTFETARNIQHFILLIANGCPADTPKEEIPTVFPEDVCNALGIPRPDLFPTAFTMYNFLALPGSRADLERAFYAVQEQTLRLEAWCVLAGEETAHAESLGLRTPFKFHQSIDTPTASTTVRPADLGTAHASRNDGLTTLAQSNSITAIARAAVTRPPTPAAPGSLAAALSASLSTTSTNHADDFDDFYIPFSPESDAAVAELESVSSFESDRGYI